MKFKKKTFFIAMRDGTFEEREGYSDEFNEFTFHKSAKGWAASDRETGAIIIWRKTRKECAAFIEDNLNKIEEARNSEANIEARKRMSDFIKCLTKE